MSPELLDAIVLITSSEPDNLRFGTGFIIRRTGDLAYVATCAHVIRDVGAGTVQVNDIAGEVVATGEHLKLDLAVVKVEGLAGHSSISSRWQESGALDQEFQTAGFQTFDRKAKTFARNELKGTLGGVTQVTARSPFNPARAWKLILAAGDLQDGHSGSPVIESATGALVGIVSHRTQEKTGIAISIEQLDRIWQPINKLQLRNALMHLGYREQTRDFYRMLRKNPIGAYLIHGPTEKYGQQWLLNRLIRQFLPSSLTAKKFRIGLDRVGRRSDVPGLWAELADEVKCDRKAQPKEIAKRLVEWWSNQDILLAVYDVDCLSEALLNTLIQEFWLPLANEAEGLLSQGCPHKLLMFLVDNEGITATRNVAIAERIDATGNVRKPFNSPPIQEFSEEEIEDWIIDQYTDLPKEVREDVEALMEASDGGIPEWTFVEICRRCGYDWRTESQTWYSI